jgi:protein-disulfide isomerase
MRSLPLTTLLCLVPALAFSADFDKDKAIGGPAAPITIEVFASFDCAHCKDLHETVIPELVRDYVISGKVFVVSREFPLDGHPYARQAANCATAAARIGKYQQVADALFRSQASWAVTGKVWDSVAGALTPAEQKKVQSLVNAPDVLAEVQRDYDAGMAAGVRRTPTMFVTHASKRFPIEGVPQYNLLRSFLNDILK